MAFKGGVYRIPLSVAGLSFSRNEDALPETALIEGTRNIEFLENGIGKRPGTAIQSNGLAAEGRGLHQFIKTSGQRFTLFSTDAGILYSNSASNPIRTGMSTQNIYSFADFGDHCFIADGATLPVRFDGGALIGVTPPTDWAATGYPFQIFPHARGTNQRMVAITSDAVWLSENGDPLDFSDGNAIKIPIPTRRGPLTGGIEFNGEVFVFDETQPFILDTRDPDTSTWGYQKAIWKGGAAHWRLIADADNELHIMTKDLSIYTVQGVQATGNYRRADLTRAAFIDRYLRENANAQNLERAHCVYDAARRKMMWFVQSTGNNTNTAIVRYLDRPNEIAWAIEDNTLYASGYNAAASIYAKILEGRSRIQTLDFEGNLWTFSDPSFADNGLSYQAGFKMKPINFEQPKAVKHVRRAYLRAISRTNANLTIRVWVDGERKSDRVLSISGDGARFDAAFFDESTFAADSIVPLYFEMNHYGEEFQVEVFQEEGGTDFFCSELGYEVQVLGVR